MADWGARKIEQLKRLYKETNAPGDQLIKDKAALEKFTGAFNQRVGPSANYVPEEVADRLLKLRKSGKLPRIRKQRLQSVSGEP
jgi:hypothetical protein